MKNEQNLTEFSTEVNSMLQARADKINAQNCTMFKVPHEDWPEAFFKMYFEAGHDVATAYDLIVENNYGGDVAESHVS